jgi:hypothetical protein
MVYYTPLDETTISLSDPTLGNLFTDTRASVALKPLEFFDQVADVSRTFWEIRSRQPAVASSSNHVRSTLLLWLGQSPLERRSCLDSGNHVVLLL